MPTLSPDELLNVTDATSLRRLFTNLGYDPIEQTTYSARTLDWPTKVAADLRGREFELLAEADAGFFQVLWLEPHPDTSGLPTDLVKRLYGDLEKRGNEAILALPSRDAGTFELVLLADLRPLDQRARPPTSFLRFSLDSRALQPHQQRALELLDVSNAGPGEAAEVVARAFRRAQQERFFRSLNFFSSYYLERRIATDTTTSAEWDRLISQMAGLRAALAGADANAALAALGWQLVPRTAPGTIARLRALDSDAALFAIVPADQPLDQALGNGSYPQLDLIAALEQEKQFDGLKWGVLTNGRTWRLYSRIAASISGAFYEVDLIDLLEFGAEEDLRYFAGFFGPAGLATGFAEKVFFSSQMLAKEVGENLKKIVFEQVFAKLANGIADDLKRRAEYDGSEAQRQLIFRTTLVLLYRVLFLLYAESMRLLPTIYPPYYAGSLTRLLTEIALQPFTEPHLRKPMHPKALWAWEWLQKLFTTVSAGSTERGVPKYNGGLFSDGAAAGGVENAHKAPHRLLAAAQIGAMDLCAALDLLGRDAAARAANNADEARRLIDYAALDVRRLGSIYEGLLEYQLAEKADGTLELRYTRQERKASGSYYTPDYIVTSIVEQAVGPVLAERERRFAALMPEVLAALTNHNTAKERLARLQHEAGETLLDLKILDPAMGSGHFLVAAVDFVADRLIAILQRHKEGNPILERLDDVRTQIRASLGEQGVDELISDEQLNNVNLLRRMVMKRCVYGVDLNDMAVELARLSLWLNSFTIGAPLSFLDHHLKWGNSLIGARVQAVQHAMVEQKRGGVRERNWKTDEIVTDATAYQFDIFGQGSAFAEMLNLGNIIEELVENPDANSQQVEHSAALYADYEQNVLKIKYLLDLWVSTSLGNKDARSLIDSHSGTDAKVRQLIDALMGNATLSPKAQQAIERARELFSKHRFLHWDLDFPEVFIDLKHRAWKPMEEAGFDAVAGNPPYLDSETMVKIAPAEREFIAGQYKTARGNWDLYIPFWEASLMLTNYTGFSSLITPNKWMSIDYGKTLRSLIGNKITSISDYSNVKVFEDASIFPVVINVSQRNVDTTTIKIFSSSSQWSTEQTVPSREVTNLDKWGAILSENFLLLTKMTKSCILLAAIAKAEEAFTVSEAYELSDFVTESLNDEPQELKLLVTGKIDRYIFLWGTESTTYLKSKYSKPVVNRRDFQRAFPKRYKQTVSSKIIISGMRYFEAVLDEAGKYIGAKSTVLVKDFEKDVLPAYLCAVLNSSFMSFFIHEKYSSLAMDGGINFTAPLVAELPLPLINYTTPAGERTALVDAAKALYEQGLAARAAGESWRTWRDRWRALWGWADARLPRQTDGTPDIAREQSDAVHDLLAFLAERMIELHKQKQAGAATFTGWLEQETGSAIDEWSGKTTVQGFWEESWENVERVLQKNRGKFAQAQGLRGKAGDAAMMPLVRAARGRWQQASDTLVPTLGAITATDRLIDLLVYRLYGLTDEEIDLVEGV